MKYGYTPKWVHPKKIITHFSEVFKDVGVKKQTCEPSRSIAIRNANFMLLLH